MKSILLIGCGHMGDALLTSWIRSKKYKLNVVDPIKYNNQLINKIMIFFDRGKFIRSYEGFKKIMSNYDQFIIDDFYQMSFQNVFHSKNVDIPELYNSWKNSIK